MRVDAAAVHLVERDQGRRSVLAEICLRESLCRTGRVADLDQCVRQRVLETSIRARRFPRAPSIVSGTADPVADSPECFGRGPPVLKRDFVKQRMSEERRPGASHADSVNCGLANGFVGVQRR